MDVPIRASYVMAVVPPEARAAAASVTAVHRSLASAVSPMLAGYVLAHSAFGWPLLIGGLLKARYDVLLLLNLRSLHPPEERESEPRPCERPPSPARHRTARRWVGMTENADELDDQVEV